MKAHDNPLYFHREAMEMARRDALTQAMLLAVNYPLVYEAIRQLRNSEQFLISTPTPKPGDFEDLI